MKFKFLKGKNEKRNRKIFSVLAFLLLISIVTIIFFGESIFSATFPNSNFVLKAKEVPMSFDSFGICLNYSDVKMYGAFWCPHCQSQKELFGDDWKNINYVECSNEDKSQTEACNIKEIKGYPTWEINGELYPGVQPLKRLSELSGCALD